MKPKAHWLRDAKLPAKAIHEAPTLLVKNGGMTWSKQDREVTVTAIDTHGAIVRRKGCMRYYAPLEEIKPV